MFIVLIGCLYSYQLYYVKPYLCMTLLCNHVEITACIDI